MRYLVNGTGGPGFSSPEEAERLLESTILPSFERLTELEKSHKILAGGLPIGDRAFVFIVEAASNEEVDRMLRNLPMWGALKWMVVPLETFEGRAAQEREIAAQLRKGAH
jgi:hypothetical protein